MINHHRQRGATLIVSLIMLVVLTLLAVSGMRSSNVNTRIAGNMQVQEEAMESAQQAIEESISNSNFTRVTPATQTVGPYTVTFAAPICQSATAVRKNDPGLPADGSCLGNAGASYCYWTTWEVAASAVDNKTGVTTSIHQGVSKLVGINDALAFCL